MKPRAIRIGIVATVASSALWGGIGTANAGGGCMHGTGATTGRGDAVQMVDACFTSTVLYVDRGTEVTWTNRDATDHNVVGVGGSWGDPDTTIAPGDSVSYRFDGDGVYPYACWIHPGMIGAIVVGDGVGTGIAGVVPGPMGDAGDAASTDEARSVLTQDAGTDRTVVWGIAAVLILVGLGGAFAVATRGRRKGPVSG
jgi:plastocyanin